jgi:hydroxylamine reductase
MFRRFCTLRTASKVSMTMPVHELLSKSFATAGNAVAALHMNRVKTVGDWKSASAEARADLIDSCAEGKSIEQLLDQAVAQQASAAAAAAAPDTLAKKFEGCDMFCMQCEQTFRGKGCFKVGVCGKTPSCAALQDLTVHYAKLLGFYLHNARQLGAPELAELNRLTLSSLFATLTNVNFDDARFVALLKELHAAVATAKASYEKAAAAKGVKLVQLPADTMLPPAAFSGDVKELTEAGRAVGVLTRFVDAGAQNAASVCEMLMYGLKGIAAYADHSLMNGMENAEIYAFMHKALTFLITSERHDLGKAVAMCLEAGKINVITMGQLYDSNKTMGVPAPNTVSVKPKPGKCILFSGHDLVILRELLPICDKEGINVYTHGEMLPAHSYPELRKHKSLAGHYGGAWMRQSVEFPHFPGAICMSTNCLTEPHENYKSRIFTCGAVGWSGVKHLGDNLSNIKFDALIAAAKAAPGFAADAKEFSYPDPEGTPKRPATHAVGFGHETVLSVAPTIIEAINKGQITRFFVVGGCDGYEGQRSYYADLVAGLPKTAVVLTVGCGKMRLLPLAEQLGTIGDTGIPRLLDMGQCNDSFSAVQVALALAKVLNCQVSDLPLSIVLSWFEQKAVAVLLSCIYLGLKPIRIGPALPAFVTPDVLKVLVEQFGILPVGDPAKDAEAMMSAKGMVEGKK